MLQTRVTVSRHARNIHDSSKRKKFCRGNSLLILFITWL